MARQVIINEERLRQLLNELGGEPEVFREVTDTFLRDLEQTREELVTAIRERDFDGQRALARVIKGNAGTMGAEWLARAAGELERGLIAAELDDATLQGGVEIEVLAAVDATSEGLKLALRKVVGGSLAEDQGDVGLR
jgi:HPt (histidine-containing phosphotransfer) domain-containing protein